MTSVLLIFGCAVEIDYDKVKETLSREVNSDWGHEDFYDFDVQYEAFDEFSSFIDKNYPKLELIKIYDNSMNDLNECNYYLTILRYPDNMQDLLDILSPDTMTQYRECMDKYFNGYIEPWFTGDYIW